jgi:altronate hydrolase
VFGANGAPTVKLATSQSLYDRMPDDFDVNAGLTSEDPAAIQVLAQRILQRWLEHAGGRLTCSEDLGVGQDEFVPWPIGVMS